MTHPLTDEMIDELAQFNSDLTGEQVVNRDHDMRAAADWQLEQVIEWIKECPNYDLDYHAECDRMIKDLKEAMRPQEDNC
jgi:hypothetical protein